MCIASVDPFWQTYCSIDFSYSVSVNLPCFYIGTVLYSYCCLVYQMWHILVSSYNLVVVHNLLLGSSKHRILTVLICWEHSLFGSYSSRIKLAYLYTTAKAITHNAVWLFHHFWCCKYAMKWWTGSRKPLLIFSVCLFETYCDNWMEWYFLKQRAWINLNDTK